MRVVTALLGVLVISCSSADTPDSGCPEADEDPFVASVQRLDTPQLRAQLREGKTGSLPYDESRLYWLAVLGETETLDALLSATRPQQQELGRALLGAAVVGCKESVSRLLDYGVPVDWRADSLESTPLVAAAQTGQTEMVRLLLARGADPGFVNYQGVGALGAALFQHHRDTAKVILDSRVGVDVCALLGPSRLTYLDIAERQKDHCAIELLKPYVRMCGSPAPETK